MTRLRNESAVALPIALGFVLVITISLATVLSMASSSQRSASFSETDQKAVAIAEAGLNHAESVLANAADPTSSSALPSSGSPTTVNVEGGTVQYWGSLDTAPTPDRWTVTALSSVAHASGASPVTHTATAQFDVNPSVPSIVGNEAWNYVFSNSTGCTTVQNHVAVSAPFYTRGDLCLKNHAQMLGSLVHVRGSLTVEDHATVGTSPAGAGDPALATGSGCRKTTSPPPLHTTCGPAQQIYRSSYSSTVPDYTKPPVNFANARLIAKPGPNQPCTVTSGTVPSFTSTGAIELMPNSSYTCQVWQSGSNVGEISWNNTTKVLTINGVVYFDGELILQNDQAGTYTGKGTVYVAKKGIMKNHSELCAVSACNTSGWDPNTRLLTLVIGASDVPAFELDNHAKLQGAVYVVGGFKIQNHGFMHGPVIAESIESLNHGFPADWPDLTGLNNGMPANGSGTATVSLVPGSWRG
jgi:Tfp pilus assembly protein PilX